MALRLGIDTGGTFTDAVLLDEASDQVVAKAKALTTRHNLIDGISASIATVLEQHDVEQIGLVCLSTTLATNSIVEGHGALAALFMVGYRDNALQLENLAAATAGMPVHFLAGGHDAGGHEVAELDLVRAREVIAELPGNVAAVAVSSMFSVRNPAHENKLRDLVREQTGLPVTCGHELSASLNAPRRALTAFLNARLVPLIQDLIVATQQTLTQHKIEAPVMVVRGDGTLVSADFASRSPVETIMSGPAASVVGAQHLAKLDNMIVSDIGGTTTDVAMIRDGQPALSIEGASVNGWRTMVEAVQIDTHGLGGDSEIQYNREKRDFIIGPGKVVPLCNLASNYPQVVTTLEEFVDQPWVKTNMARFIVLRQSPWDGLRLTAQQRDLVEQVRDAPQSMQSVFAERHFSRAMKRLIEIGVLTLAGFTPTDAAHVCGLYRQWDAGASALGAQLLRRYSQWNLGEQWPDDQTFAQAMLAAVTRETAFCLLTAVMNDQGGRFGRKLSTGQRQLLHHMFVSADPSAGRSRDLAMQVQVGLPVVGIGAPAQCFYPAVAPLLETTVTVPEHAEVANALGAVVGVVRHRAQMVISPVSATRVVVHAGEQQREFDDLEEAAGWATELVQQIALEKAQSAGGTQLEVNVQRDDNIVERDGQKTFFESTIVATVTGRVGKA
jgi:N-methylhydantoinase A/oxoprolinase/acetone carboxylase beta subunit